MYSLLRPLLFCLDPETAHRVTMKAMRRLDRLGLVPAAAPSPSECERTVMGIRFPNPVGLAAGLDKNGEYLDALARLGFGFIEVGTVTPRPQPGNPRPRMFRLRAARAVINRLGFNNDGVDRLVENVKRARYRGVLGINIGKNFDTPLERAASHHISFLTDTRYHAAARASGAGAFLAPAGITDLPGPVLRCRAPQQALITLLGFHSHLGSIADWGLELHGKRQIAVNPMTMETSLPLVYSAGDVAGYMQAPLDRGRDITHAAVLEWWRRARAGPTRTTTAPSRSR